MAEDEVLAKSERLVRLQSLLLNHPRGLTTEELAERCGVCRRTVQRDLRSLERMGLPLAQEGNRYCLPPSGLMPPLKLRLEEATSLFIAARLLCRYSDEHNPWVTEALRKLAAVLPAAVGEHVQRCAEDAAREGDERYSRVFCAVTRAWALRRKVRIWYRAKDSNNLHDYVVCPYFIEPSAVGFSAYLIGHSTYFDSLRTFKIERIERAEETGEAFVSPSDFDPCAWLSGAWGVMAGGEPETVILRFSPAASRRVKESVWHRSQCWEDCPDGALLFTVRVDEPREMLPWIRGWGPDVEVIGPEWLRARIAEEAKKTALIYGGQP